LEHDEVGGTVRFEPSEPVAQAGDVGRLVTSDQRWLET
jgi:hypothetical protein